MDKYIFLILSVFFSFATNAQTLKTTNLNISTNGRIYDIDYIPSVNAYVVVGEFTNIGGFTRNNIAYLNGNNLSVIGGNPISSIDGAIRSVEYKSLTVLGVTYHYMFIGGEFNTINGNPRESLAIFHTSGSLALNSFSIYSWNYAMQSGNGNYDDGVFDLEVKGDTLLVAGSFYGINLQTASSTAISYSEDNFMELKIGTSGALLSAITATTDPNYFNVPPNPIGALSVLSTNNTVFASGMQFDGNGGSGRIGKYDGQLNFTNFLVNNGAKYGYHSLEKLNDSLIVATDMGTSPNYIPLLAIFKQSGNSPLGIPQYDVNPALSGFSSNVWAQNSYNGDLLMYKGTTPTLQRHRLNTALVSNTLDFTQVGTSISVTSPGSHLDTTNNLMIVGRYLFLSERGMTTVGGQARAGVAVFCLEPENPLAFVNPDLSVCPDETVTYTIPDVNYETGYKWTYSGTGIQYSVNGGAFQNYTAPVMNTTANASSITIKFPLGSTSGTLTVEPYNTCNTTSDYLYAKPQSITITVNPQPDLTLNADSLWFTCIVDSINLVAQSVTPSVVYEWAYPNVLTPVSSNDTLLINSTGVFPSIFYPTGNYYIKATNTVTGCTKRDSMYIGQNTTPPVISSVSSNPADFKCSTTSMELTAVCPNATLYWTTDNDLITQFSNPHTIYSTVDLNFIAHATSTINGCTATQAFPITQNDTTFIRGNLPLHPWFPNALVTDTINCVNQTALLQCGVDPTDPNAAAGTVWWSQTGTTSLNIATTDSLGMDAGNHTKVWQFVTLNANNDCYDTNEVVIFFDLDHPFVVDYAAASTLNCSVDTMTLIHPLTGGSVTESWLDGAGTPTGSNSLFVNATGDYIYQVQYNQNGCVSTDTVSVIQTSELYLSSNDTVVCPGIAFSVSTTIINNTETPMYLWSNGETTPTATGTGGIDTELSVIVTTPAGCTGYDTIQISITAPVQLQTVAFMSCGGTNGSLQVTNATGGAGSYQYSIDGVTFSTNPLFDSLSPGEYTIYVQDALGCVYSFDDTLDAMASAPPMDFLVSTYSASGDTLAIVNTTVFAGFDSTNWIFPAGTIIVFDSDSLALVQLPDTGWFEITLIGYDDTCQYTFTKTIYSGEVAPEYPTDYASVKIQSLIAFPNPTTGAFTVELVFGTAQNYSVIVTNDLSQPVAGMYQSGYGTSVTLPFTFPFGTPPGAYHIHVVSDYDARQFTLILN